MTPWVVSIALFVYLIFSEIKHFYERKDLLNRIMSKDYNELKTWESFKTKTPKKEIIKL